MKQNIKKLFIGAVSGLFFGFIAYQYQPITWKANALVSLAAYKPDNDLPFVALESTSVTLERLKNKSFLMEASKRVKSKYRANFLNSEVDIKIVRGRTPDELPALILNLHGESADYVKNALTAIIQELESKHQHQIDNYRNSVYAQLSKFERDALTAHTADLKINSSTNSISSKIDENVILAILEQATKLFKLQYFQHEVALISDYNLRNTTELEPIYIKDEKIFNTLYIALLTGTFLGILAAVFYGLVRNNWSRFVNTHQVRKDHHN